MQNNIFIVRPSHGKTEAEIKYAQQIHALEAARELIAATE